MPPFLQRMFFAFSSWNGWAHGNLFEICLARCFAKKLRRAFRETVFGRVGSGGTAKSVVPSSVGGSRQPRRALLLLLLLLCEGRVFFSPRRRNLVLSCSLLCRPMGTCLSSPPEEPAAIKRLRRSNRGSSGATRVSKRTHARMLCRMVFSWGAKAGLCYL